MSSPESRDLLEQLLAEEATQGLSDLETLELERLLEELGTDRSECGYEHAAAALEVAFSASQRTEVPSSVSDGLAELATRAGREGTLLTFPTHAQSRQATGGSSSTESSSPTESPSTAESSSPQQALWLLAAAAAIVLLGIAPRFFDRAGAPPLAEPAAVVATDRLQLDLSATDDAAAAGASGQVLWSTTEQRGEMRIAGLEANDPTVSQYQLWIFDEAQDERYPIDGGVFDVASGDVVIPIDAKIEVRNPTLFAITVEKPGGVVVSGRKRIVLVAPVA